MTRKALIFIGAIAVMVFTAALEWQRQNIRQLREEIARLSAARIEQERIAAESADQARRLSADLENSRTIARELAQLRSETASLRRRSMELEAEKKEAEEKSKPRPQATEPAPEALPQVDSVETFRAVANASIAWGETMVTGGWKTPGHKRVVVLAEPSLEPNGESIKVRARILEVPEAGLASLGLERIGTDNTDVSSHLVIPTTEASAILEGLKKIPGGDLLSAPTLITGSGIAADVNISHQVKTSDGETRNVGPLFHFLPERTSTGVTLGLAADLRLPVGERK